MSFMLIAQRQRFQYICLPASVPNLQERNFKFDQTFKTIHLKQNIYEGSRPTRTNISTLSRKEIYSQDKSVHEDMMHLWLQKA